MQTVGIGNIYHFPGLKKQKHFHIEALYGIFRKYRTECQNKAVIIGRNFKFFQTFF